MRESKIRPIAIHLPQYHPIPENDQWWGKGFTEWTNVVNARPLFPGHYQPQLPADLGYYDMRHPETMHAQAELAKQYGVYGFCYYHYWFNGKLLLETPLHQMLELKEPEMPFMLCWANENWTRRWDGWDQEILMEQKYSDQDDDAHITYLMQFLKDPRYIKMDGKPVLIIYKTFLLPNPQKTAATWRKIAAANGLELYLCHMAFSYREKNTLEKGFDAVIDFEPFGIRRKHSVFDEVSKQRRVFDKHNVFHRILSKSGVVTERMRDPLLKYNVLDYDFCLRELRSLQQFDFKMYPSLVPGWDNSPRKKNDPTLLLKGSTPQKFQQWMTNILADFKPFSEQENFVFINAWNEWAEGNHLEPCLKWGTAYLQGLKNALEERIPKTRAAHEA